MGNYIRYRSFDDQTGRVILSDGRVHEFVEPVTVAELMLEHPQQVVVELSSVENERRPTPLPADKKLETHKVYLMLPVKRGKPAALTAEEARRILLNSNAVLRSRPGRGLSSSRVLPLFARICSAGNREMGQKCAQVEKKEEKPVEVMSSVTEFLPESMEGRPEYLSRQLSGKGWKPSLDTIKEKKVQRKIPHWLF